MFRYHTPNKNWMSEYCICCWTLLSAPPIPSHSFIFDKFKKSGCFLNRKQALRCPWQLCLGFSQSFPMEVCTDWFWLVDKHLNIILGLFLFSSNNNKKCIFPSLLFLLHIQLLCQVIRVSSEKKKSPVGFNQVYTDLSKYTEYRISTKVVIVQGGTQCPSVVLSPCWLASTISWCYFSWWKFTFQRTFSSHNGLTCFSHLLTSFLSSDDNNK